MFYAVLSDKIMMLIIGFIPFTRYVGEGARMVRELFQMARSKKACIVFFDEVRRRGHGGGDWGARRGGRMCIIGNTLLSIWYGKLLEYVEMPVYVCAICVTCS